MDREFKNYQIISNLSLISKSIEKAALLQLSTYFEDQNLLSSYQSANCKHHSTETAVLNIHDEILQNAEYNKGTSMVCLNLNDPFDTVNHTILKAVLEHYFGLKDTALQWLSTYVSDRQFSVQIGNSFLQTHTINFSVLQGSILGPVLFSCYVSTLPEVKKQTTDITISGYSDDHVFTQVFTQKDTLVKHTIEEKVDRIKNWMCMNYLQMNNKNCILLLVHQNCLVKRTLTQSQLEQLQSIAQKQSNFLVPTWMKHCLLGNM